MIRGSRRLRREIARRCQPIRSAPDLDPPRSDGVGALRARASSTRTYCTLRAINWAMVAGVPPACRMCCVVSGESRGQGCTCLRNPDAGRRRIVPIVPLLLRPTTDAEFSRSPPSRERQLDPDEEDGRLVTARDDGTETMQRNWPKPFGNW